MEVRGGLGGGDRGLYQAAGLAEGRGPEALGEASFPGWASGRTGDGALMGHRLSFLWGPPCQPAGVGSWWLVNWGLSRLRGGHVSVPPTRVSHGWGPEPHVPWVALQAECGPRTALHSLYILGHSVFKKSEKIRNQGKVLTSFEKQEGRPHPACGPRGPPRTGPCQQGPRSGLPRHCCPHAELARRRPLTCPSRHWAARWPLSFQPSVAESGAGQVGQGSGGWVWGPVPRKGGHETVEQSLGLVESRI